MLSAAVVAALIVPPTVFAADPNQGLETRVREYFADAPVMIEIARCESEMRQFAANGSALYGGASDKMIGLFQVHTGVHTTMAQKLGFDLKTVDGNLAYARYLYESEGTVPWNSSYTCWRVAKAELDQGRILPALMGANMSGLTLNLEMGMDHPQVEQLQRLLNNAGFAVADSGGGSPGNETSYFGGKTRAALMSFQCARGIVCEGDERTTGYGRVGPKTRTLLASAHEKSTISSSTSNVPTTTPAPSLQATSLMVTQESYTLEELERISQLQAQIALLMEKLEQLKAGTN